MKTVLAMLCVSPGSCAGWVLDPRALMGTALRSFGLGRGRIAPATKPLVSAAGPRSVPANVFHRLVFKPRVSCHYPTKSNSSATLRLRTWPRSVRCELIRMQTRTSCNSRVSLRSGNLLDLPTTSGRIGCFSGDFQLFVAFDSRAVSKWRQTLSIT